MRIDENDECMQMTETYQAKFDALVERERRATEQLQRQQEV